MVMVGIHEAKTTLSKLIQRVHSGEEVVITNSGVPVARLVTVAEGGPRQLGLDAGRFVVPERF